MNEPIFVYGDYDMDGFSAGMVWDEILRAIYNVPVVHYRYHTRTHLLDPDIIQQVEEAKTRVVIICDTGSSFEDRDVLMLLRSKGHTPIVIDHHVWDGDYQADKKNFLTYNAYEERDLLQGCEISGAYASLLVASRLITKYFSRSIIYNAMVYALASMYADVVDIATPPGRALYNCVALLGRDGPELIRAMNSFGYTLNRMLFSFIVNPKINACFRAENYAPLNRSFTCRDAYSVRTTAKMMADAHAQSRELVASFVPCFTRERFGEIVLCTHNMTEDTYILHIRNYTGLIANKIAKEEQAIAVVLVKTDKKYEGSFRDFYNRKLLDVFQLFSDAGGHDSAFGLVVENLEEFRRYLRGLSVQLSAGIHRDYITISSSVVTDIEDVQVTAMFNEYMNVRPRLYISHRPSIAQLKAKSAYYKYYNVGLPMQVKSQAPILQGNNILIEPRITKDVELWGVD